MSKSINKQSINQTQKLPSLGLKTVVILVLALLASFNTKIQAATFEGIQNPATGNLGNNPDTASSGEMFVSIFISLWNTAISVGAIITIAMFLWGSIEWITASGDSAKVTKGQQKMLQAALGLFVLVSSFIIIGFVSSILFGTQFDILRPKFFAPGDGS